MALNLTGDFLMVKTSQQSTIALTAGNRGVGVSIRVKILKMETGPCLSWDHSAVMGYDCHARAVLIEMETGQLNI